MAEVIGFATSYSACKEFEFIRFYKRLEINLDSFASSLGLLKKLLSATPLAVGLMSSRKEGMR
jgi:hypothetical protein